MKKTAYRLPMILVVLISFTFISCEFSFSVGGKKNNYPNDIEEKLSVKSNGIKYNKLTISDGFNEIRSSKLIYGSKIMIGLEGLTGFQVDNDTVHPGVQLVIRDSKKDTIISNYDVYKDFQYGIHLEDLETPFEFTLADPMRSGENYQVIVDIWDKKSEAKLTSTLDVSVIADESVEIENKGFKYDEIYIYSEKRGVITDGKILLNENVYFIFEGLEGFKDFDGNGFIGASIDVRNNFGIKLLNEPDLYDTPNGVELSKIKESVSPYIVFNEKDNEGPLKLKCKVRVWDRKSNRFVEMKTKLELVDELEW